MPKDQVVLIPRQFHIGAAGAAAAAAATTAAAAGAAASSLLVCPSMEQPAAAGMKSTTEKETATISKREATTTAGDTAETAATTTTATSRVKRALLSHAIPQTKTTVQYREETQSSTGATAIAREAGAAKTINGNLFGLSCLPEDVLCRITSFLDACELVKLRCCNKWFHDLASRNEAGWKGLCLHLWKDKVHVLKKALKCAACGSVGSSKIYNYMFAYRLSLEDASNRDHMTREELCFDASTDDDVDVNSYGNANESTIHNNKVRSDRDRDRDQSTDRGSGGCRIGCRRRRNRRGTVWSFRFKESAGSDWTSVDPWYHGLPCRKMVFLKDGTIKQYVSTEGMVDGESSSSSSTSSSSSRQQQQHSHHRQVQDETETETESGSFLTTEDEGVLVDPPMTMTWRFLTRPMDLPTRPLGSYVRITVGGRDVPTYSVRRSPTGNWGFLMESCWGLYASFDLPPRRSDSSFSRSSSRRRRLRRTADGGAMWIDVSDDYDTDDNLEENDVNNINNNADAESTTNHPRRMARNRNDSADTASSFLNRAVNDDYSSILMDDSRLGITNEVQWREAFLYNVGARILPEGDDATDEFDRAFRM